MFLSLNIYNTNKISACSTNQYYYIANKLITS